jgi:hypothetical protein
MTIEEVQDNRYYWYKHFLVFVCPMKDATSKMLPWGRADDIGAGPGKAKEVEYEDLPHMVLAPEYKSIGEVAHEYIEVEGVKYPRPYEKPGDPVELYRSMTFAEVMKHLPALKKILDYCRDACIRPEDLIFVHLLAVKRRIEGGALTTKQMQEMKAVLEKWTGNIPTEPQPDSNHGSTEKK